MRSTVAKGLAVLLAATAAGAQNVDAPAGAPPGLLLAPPVDPDAARTEIRQAIRAAEAASHELKTALEGAGARPAAEPAPARPADPPISPPPAPAPSPDRATVAPPADPEAARAEAAERIKAIEKDKPADAREIREILEDRLKRIKEWEKAAEARKVAEDPKVSPEREADELRATLERSRAGLARLAKDPDAALPEVFRATASGASEAALKEMKEAIDAAEDVAKDRKAAMDVARAAAERKAGGPLVALRADRDALRKRWEALAARKGAEEAALAAAKTVEARSLARDRLLNSEWETRAVAESGRANQAAIATETKREALIDLRRQAREAASELAEKSLERMRARYRGLADRQQRDLARQAADEHDRAARAADPVERYRARRAAELLDLEAELLKEERTLAARPAISLEEQTALADRAAEDFSHLKKLVEGGRSGALVALRLNASYQRTASERDRLVRQDLARAGGLLEIHENALTDLELDALNDAREERATLDLLLEGLPPSRRPAALALAADLDSKRRAVLSDRRLALQRLAERAEDTQKQLNRRLRILDEQHAFIRTHIFWVRDLPPVDFETLGQAHREARRLLHALLRLPLDPSGHTRWGRASWEFTLACLGIVLLPIPLALARRTLGRAGGGGSLVENRG